MRCEGSKIFALLKINTSLLNKVNCRRCTLTTDKLNQTLSLTASSSSDRHLSSMDAYSLNKLLMQMIICKSNLRQQVYSLSSRYLECFRRRRRRHFFHSVVSLLRRSIEFVLLCDVIDRYNRAKVDFVLMSPFA